MSGTRSVVSTSTERVPDCAEFPAASVTLTLQKDDSFVPVTAAEVIPS